MMKTLYLSIAAVVLLSGVGCVTVAPGEEVCIKGPRTGIEVCKKF